MRRARLRQRREGSAAFGVSLPALTQPGSPKRRAPTGGLTNGVAAPREKWGEHRHFNDRVAASTLVVSVPGSPSVVGQAAHHGPSIASIASAACTANSPPV